MLNAAAIKAYLYAKHGGKKPTINLKKEGEKLFLIGICAALAFTAWFYIPALSSVLLYFLVPLTFYFLYNIYNFLKHCLHKFLNKDNKTHDENKEDIKALAIAKPDDTIKTTACFRHVESLPDNIPEFVLESLKKSAVQNPQKASDLIMCVKQTELIINGLEQTIKDKFYNFIVPTGNIDEKIKLVMNIQNIASLMKKASQSARDKFYESLMTLVFTDHQKAYNSAVWICKVDNLFNKVSQPIRDRFYEYVMNLTLTNHEKAYSLATWIRDNDALLNRVKQCTESEHYKYVTNLSFTNREKAHALATLIVKVNNQFNEIRPHIRNKFFDPIIEIAYTDRDDALVLATIVKEIDDTVSGIKNEALLNYFDKSFTFTETQHFHKRAELIKFAGECKQINEAAPDITQTFLATQVKSRPEGFLTIKPTDVINCLGTASSCLGAATSKVNSYLSFISGISKCVQGGDVRSNYCGH